MLLFGSSDTSSIRYSNALLFVIVMYFDLLSVLW